MQGCSPRAFPITLASLLLSVSLTAQVQWTQQKPKISPPVIADHVFVSYLGGAYIFGGAGPQQSLTNATWSFDGTTWTKLTPKTSPSARMRHAGAYDQRRRRFVIYGGSTATSSGRMGDTWEFDGTNWAQVKTAKSPGIRSDAAMAYDSHRGLIYLFGGNNGTSDLNDLWSYDGKNWTKLAPKVSPGARRDHNLVYDSVRRKLVTYGGFWSGFSVRNDLWEFDGTTWTQAKPKTFGPTRVGASAAFDAYRGRTVFFSGYDGVGQPAQTWEWDGVDWIQRKIAVQPAGRSGHAMVYDFLKRRCYMLGGWTSAFTNETWVYEAPKLASYANYGSGCKGSVGTPALSLEGGALPWTGESLKVRVSTMPKAGAALMLIGFSKTKWGPFNLPLDLSSLGLSACKLACSPDLAGILVNVSGAALWTLPIPNDPSLAGLHLYHQALVFDKSANKFGAVLSNAGDAGIGSK